MMNKTKLYQTVSIVMMNKTKLYQTVSIVMMTLDKVIPDCEYCNDE